MNIKLFSETLTRVNKEKLEKELKKVSKEGYIMNKVVNKYKSYL